MDTCSRGPCSNSLLAVLLTLCILLTPTIAVALEQGKAGDSVPREAMALSDAVLKALQRNLDITISRKTRDIRLTDIIFEQAKFDPTLDLSGRYDSFKDPQNAPLFALATPGTLGDPQVFDKEQSAWSLGITQKLITGGDYNLSFDTGWSYVDSENQNLFNPSHESNLTLSLSQPLLRGFGQEVNETQIRIAQNNAKVEDHIFFDRVLTVIATVEQAYWELVFAIEGLKVAQIALKAAEELEATNQAKADAGIMTIVDVLQAKSAVASRQELVIIAEKAIHDQEDELRRLLNPSEEELRRQVRVIPIDKPDQTLAAISLQEAIDIAMERRPDVLQAVNNIETSKLNTRFAQNQLLPSLTLEGTGGLIGLGKDVGDMLDRGSSGDFYNYGVGLVLSYPLGNRSAWSQYNRRKLEAVNATASLQRARQQVIINVKEAVRRVQTDFKRIETTRSARILKERQLNAEKERLSVGLSTTRFVLDFQRDLAIAQRNDLRAIVDYNNALSNLARQKGTTLEGYGIELD